MSDQDRRNLATERSPSSSADGSRVIGRDRWDRLSDQRGIRWVRVNGSRIKVRSRSDRGSRGQEPLRQDAGGEHVAAEASARSQEVSSRECALTGQEGDYSRKARRRASRDKSPRQRKALAESASLSIARSIPDPSRFTGVQNSARHFPQEILWRIIRVSTSDSSSTLRCSRRELQLILARFIGCARNRDAASLECVMIYVNACHRSFLPAIDLSRAT